MCMTRGRTMSRESREDAVLVPRSTWRRVMVAMTAMDLALEARSEEAAGEYALVALRELAAARRELG